MGCGVFSTPRLMQAAMLDAYTEDIGLSVHKLKPPSPGPGQVLVRVHRAPVHPVDLCLFTGEISQKPAVPFIPGLEASGTVVVGSSQWLGKRVHVYSSAKPYNQVWAEYAVFESEDCVELWDSTDFDQGALLSCNPLTVLYFKELLLKGKHRAAVQSAANSCLGRMLIRLCESMHLPLINIVQSAEKAEDLRALGCEHLLDSSASCFEEDYLDLCLKLGATVGFDTVAGEFSGKLLKGLCPGGVLYVHSGLVTDKYQHLSIYDVIFAGKTMEGVFISQWFEGKTKQEREALYAEIQRDLKGVFASQIAGHFSLADVKKAVQTYACASNAGKILLHPH